ncbi:ABC transporter ATP-binding protein [Aquabacterium sp. J223]|uniref:ABC transporter ATP-binding protein n=1 Tax=Aquabacterium sp. J223 TaxID=2898431 RepID=UPI0021AD9071|nr:ABC transporter ATP-binding protein [Aquabacterium sp. J223]UUX95245.1 ABC transporter ATP-binding protein [Aquabacterium sp. J223]UUX96717.1 ABC transporter ATP-binding protein [Aquabacterium sp. J223]
MTDPILTVRGLRKSFGATEIIRGIDLDLAAGERRALIGPNGAGKSTLFHLVSGQLRPSAGEVLFDGQRIDGRSPQRINRLGLARSFQITNIFPRLTVFENIRIAVMQRAGLQYSFWRRLDGLRPVREAAERLMERVRLQAHADALAGELSYSGQRSLELAMTLASDPQVILLDEPMAGMSAEETDYTLALIREVTAGRALLIVEHDMDVVFALADRISVLVYGQVIATGTPAEVRADPAVREAYLGEEAAA